MLIYCDECRNEHFHKDNISNPTEVEVIRSNTLQLLFWLIGGFKLTGTATDDNNLLGIPNRDFDRFYWAVKKCSCGGGYFSITFGCNTYLVAMPMHQVNAQIDSNGLLFDTNLRFVIINRATITGWENDNWQTIENDISSENVLLVTRDHMPDSLKFINKMTGKATSILW